MDWRNPLWYWVSVKSAKNILYKIPPQIRLKPLIDKGFKGNKKFEKNFVD